MMFRNSCFLFCIIFHGVFQILFSHHHKVAFEKPYSLAYVLVIHYLTLSVCLVFHSGSVGNIFVLIVLVPYH